MQSCIDNEIEMFKQNGADLIDVQTINFTSNTGWDAYLAVGACSYYIDVRRETIWRCDYYFRGDIQFEVYTEERYVASVIVFDTYNFDEKPNDSIGNVLNNIARFAHDKGGIGLDYTWQAAYTYCTPWERIS